MPRVPKALKTSIKVALAFLFALFLALGVVKGYADATYYKGYDASLPLNAEVHPPTLEDGYRRVPFYFDGVPGERVPGLMALPVEGDGPFPCVIFLHGIGQKKEFLDEIAAPFTRAGFAMATFDQYTRGERRLTTENPLKELKAFRRRGALTVLETRRLVDYLQTRPDIDADRIYLVGASYGAITGVPAAAFENRIRAVVLIYGGGNLRLLLKSDAAAQELGSISGLVARFGALLLAPSDPVRHVARIAPRPILFQNGEADSLIPVPSARALQEAAGEPKEILWYAGDHIGLEEDTVRRVLNDALAWLQKQDEALAPQG